RRSGARGALAHAGRRRRSNRCARHGLGRARGRPAPAPDARLPAPIDRPLPPEKGSWISSLEPTTTSRGWEGPVSPGSHFPLYIGRRILPGDSVGITAEPTATSDK